MAIVKKSVYLLTQALRAVYAAYHPFSGISIPCDSSDFLYNLVKIANKKDLHIFYCNSCAEAFGISNTDFLWHQIGEEKPLVSSSEHCSNYISFQNKSRARGVNLYGYLNADFGLGEDARQLYNMLVRLNIPVDIYNISPSPSTRVKNYGFSIRSWEEPNRFSVNIFCMSLFELVKLFARKPYLFFDGFNIAYAPWELNKMDDRFLFLDNIISEYWVPTKYVQEVYSNTFFKPVKLIPYISDVSLDSDCKIDRYNSLESSNVVTYILIADFNSSEKRKNIFNSIRIFQEAFCITESVKLIVKVMGNISEENKEKLRRICANDERIELVNDVLDRRDLLELLAKSDVLISLHRSEGFGRVPLEAMALGVSVIATQYSGVEDYLSAFNSFCVKYSLRSLNKGDYPYAPENAVWAEPIKEHVIKQLRRSYRFSLLRRVRSYFGRRAAKRYTVRSLESIYQKNFSRVFHKLQLHG